MLTKPKGTPGTSANTSMYSPNRRRGLSPLMIIGISIPVLLVLIGAGVIVAMPKLFSHAAANPAVPNPNCTLIVPANALSAKGLATPYQIFAPDAAANGPCNESNVNQSAFVQADIYDPATGKITTYSPLVIDKGTTPAVVPTVPTLPAGAVVGLWTGFNGTLLTLQGTNAKTLMNAKCVNGLNGSVFGQFAYCNAPAFFTAAKAGIAAGKLVIPPLGVSPKDGKACPSTRDFPAIDQDQSDNVQTQYLVNGTQIAQNTAANKLLLPNSMVDGNPSDNALITTFIDPALGCTPFTVPDIANNNAPVSTLATDELQASMFQQAPIALVPLNDPMTLNNNNASMRKTNLYRAGVDQPPINANVAATTGSATTYCQNFVAVTLPAILGDMNITMNATSPAPAMANSLFTFLAMRAQQSYVNLGCQALLNNAPNPVTTTVDGNGVVISATFKLPAAAGTGTTGTGTTTGTTTTTTTNTATGTANINANFDAGNADLSLTASYPGHTNAPITVSIVDSATTKAVFSQQINTDNNGQAALSSAINGLQGLTAIPATWTYVIADPNKNNTVVGSAAVVANGVTANATIAAPAAAPAATTATPAAVTSPAAPAAAGQVTTTNAPFKGMAKKKW